MATEDARKLFVAGLPDSITEDVLRQLFEAAGGNIVSISLPRDRATGRPRGFGFVTLSSPEEAERIRGALDGSMQAGRPISVRPFSSEPPRRGETRPEPAAFAAPQQGDRTVYVGNLPYDVSQQELEQVFTDAGSGPVVRVHLPTGPDGRPRGFGFVTLATAEGANAALEGLRDADVRGRRLQANIAHPRGERPPPGERPPLQPRPAPSGPSERRPGLEFREAREPRPLPAGGARTPDLESARPVEGRRARPPVESKKKKAKNAKRRPLGGEDRRERGGGNSWQNWDDIDDEK
jgi:RNA recognition motif-containing protein